MSYLLDTNVVVSLLRNRPPRVREHYREVLSSGDSIMVSTIVLFELWYGVSKSSRIQENTERLRIFLAGDVDVLEFGQDDGRTAGRVRTTLEKAGTPIGAYDVLIAGQALERGLTLATANTREFQRVEGLTWEDWTT